jgi:hypothetical protein
MIFGCIEHHTWAFLRGEADFNVDQVADTIANVIYRGMVAVPPPEGDRMEQVVARLEAAAGRIENSRGG